MFTIQWFLLRLFLIVNIFNILLCNAKDFTLIPADIEQIIRNDLFLTENSTILNPIIIQLSSNSNKWTTANLNCLNELHEIADAANKFEEWAMELVDSWGELPHDIMSGNFFSLGKFSQCLHIKRNGMDHYRTQYCIAQFKFHSNETLQQSKAGPWLDVVLPTISLGICLPAVCSTAQLELLGNEAVHSISSRMYLEIPKISCQFEETISGMTTLDFVAITLIGIVLLLIVASTTYDIFCTMNNLKKNQWLLIFSAYKNGMDLFKCETAAKTSNIRIDCLNGIRVISTIWILILHVGTVLQFIPLANRLEMLTTMRGVAGQFVISGIIANENFFLMSALLASINQLKLLKKNGKLNVLSLYFHRVLRISPLFFFTVLISMTLFRYMGSGPLWTILLQFFSGHCKKFYWSTLFFIENYVNPDYLCYPLAWHLCVDMQLFIITPAIVYLIYRFRIKALIAVGAVIAACAGLTIYLHVKYNLRTIIAGDKATLTYVPTHIRMSSWMIGIIGGYIFTEYPQDSARMSTKFNLLILGCAFAAMIAIILGYYPQELILAQTTPFYYGLYDALFGRILWPLALCYIIFSCAHRSDGFLNRILSHRFWQPASRLSYSIFCAHFSIILILLGTTKSPLHFSIWNYLQTTVIALILSIVFGILTSLAFEMPFLNFGKLIFTQKSNSPNNLPKNIVLNGNENNNCKIQNQ